MVKIISKGSQSFARAREFMRGVNIDNRLISTLKKKDLLAYMHENSYNEREVYYAEALRSKSADEIKDIIKRLTEYIKREIKKREITIHGIVEAHSQGDFTSKSAHIHYWGTHSALVSPIISEFIHKNRLTVKISQSLKYANMELGKYYRLNLDGSVYNITDEVNIETKAKSSTDMIDDSLSRIDKIISLLDSRLDIVDNYTNIDSNTSILDRVSNILDKDS